MTSSPRDNSGAEGDAIKDNSAATSHEWEDIVAQMGSASLSICKGKKRRRASSGSVQGNLRVSNARGPAVDTVIHKAKGKRCQKAGSCDADASPPEETSHKPSEEVRELADQEAEPRMLFSLMLLTFAAC